VGSIERRLDKLERLAVSRHEDKSGSPRYLEAYFRALENLERKEAGLPPLPYTEEDRKDDEGFLRETLPAYRADPGWQTEQAQRILNEWEKHTMHSLENGA
jgi:CHASE3 domain sensor protein